MFYMSFSQGTTNLTHFSPQRGKSDGHEDCYVTSLFWIVLESLKIVLPAELCTVSESKKKKQ